MHFLTEYSAAVFERLILKLEVVAHAAKRNTVHEMRVDMKRIHSLLYLVNHTGADKKLTEPAFLKKIFVAAGELREVQVEMKLLRKWKMGGKTKVYLKWSELERRNKQKLHRAVNQPGQKILENFHDKLDMQLSLLDRMKAIHFLKEQYGALQSGYEQKKLKRKKLHEIRKILKNFLYLLEALDPKKDCHGIKNG
jgi:CHAD domain-containing protein